MAKNKDVLNYLGIGGISILTIAAVSAGLMALLKFPVPVIGEELIVNRDIQAEKNIANQWENVVIYQPKKADLEEIKNEQEGIDGITSKDVAKAMSFLDSESLNSVLKDKDNINSLIIDNTKSRESIGIKTTQGDELILLDTIDGIAMAKLQVAGNDGTLVFVRNPKQLDFSIVDDLSYWEYIDKHKEREGALLAVNANDYTWHSSGRYATMDGLAIRHGDMIRKNSTSDVVGFTEDGVLQVGSGVDLNKLYNASECGPILIKDGEDTYSPDGNESRFARTAISQLEDGTVLLIKVDGDEDGNGATFSELLDIFKKYGVKNAAALSSGSKSVMYWDKGIIGKEVGENGLGVKLPTAFVVKPSNSLPEDEQFNIESYNKDKERP